MNCSSEPVCSKTVKGISLDGYTGYPTSYLPGMGELFYKWGAVHSKTQKTAKDSERRKKTPKDVIFIKLKLQKSTIIY